MLSEDSGPVLPISCADGDSPSGPSGRSAAGDAPPTETGGKTFTDLASRTARQRWVHRLDMAAMLAFRERLARAEWSDLYMAYDVSPQCVEISNCAVVVVTPQPGSPPVVRRTRLPMVILGHGNFKLVDKLAALLHQLFLVFGPSHERMLAACGSVRMLMSDMGTE